jgi:hypothetical protein
MLNQHQERIERLRLELDGLVLLPQQSSAGIQPEIAEFV